MSPSLNDLNLSAESVPQVDWNAPEVGSMPPQVTPGTFTFLFKLPENPDDWFDKQNIEVGKIGNGQPIKKDFLVLMYEAEVLGDKDGNPYPPNEDGSPLPTLRYQRASFYKNDKMLISRGADLLRNLGIRIAGALTPEAIKAEVEKVNGRVSFRGEVGWRTYFKSTETTVSSTPRRKRGEFPWPKESDGTFALQVGNPKNPNDQKQYARAEIIAVHAATGIAQSA